MLYVLTLVGANNDFKENVLLNDNILFPISWKKIAVVVFYKKDRMEKQTKKVDKIGMLE